MHPESIAFDASGHVFVGQGDGTTILEFDSLGNPITSFSPVLDARGTDWIELAADNCTIFYTSEGTLVKRFNVCTNTQLPDFNTVPLPGAAAYAHRILLPFQFGAGGVLVADTDRIVRLDSSGAQAQTYTFTGATFLFALNLDPDGTSFWTADLNNGQVYKVDIQSARFFRTGVLPARAILMTWLDFPSRASSLHRCPHRIAAWPPPVIPCSGRRIINSRLRPFWV
jgi:hypothetical protein